MWPSSIALTFLCVVAGCNLSPASMSAGTDAGPRLGMPDARTLDGDDAAADLDGAFTLVVMPDTQSYVGSDTGTAIFASQSEWIVANRASLDIKMVSHLGDVVQLGYSELEWARARSAMQPLIDSATPFSILPGNHDDIDGPERWLNFSTHFPVSMFADKPWWGGAYDAYNSSQYMTFTAGSTQFLLVSLRWWPGAAVIDWANSVIQSHPEHKVIVSTHGYLNAAGERAYGTTSFEYIWTDLVVPNPNVFMVLCGHDITGGEAFRIDSVGTRKVFQLLSNYQTRRNGGNGLLRLMRFVPSEQEIQVQTFSTWLTEAQCSNTAIAGSGTVWRPTGCYEVDASSEFEISVAGQGVL